MLTIRLSRMGKKKAAQYRIVLQENHRDPWSPAIEILGSYDPRVKENAVVLKDDRIKYWLSQGAQPSATVHNMLVAAKIIEGDTVNSVTISKKRSAKLGEKVAEKKAKAEEALAKAAEAKAKEAEEKAAAQEAKKAAEEAKAEEKVAEPTQEKTEEVSVEEAPAEESKSNETTS